MSSIQDISQPSFLVLNQRDDCIFRCNRCGSILLIEFKKKINEIEIFTKCRNNHQNIYSLNNFITETSKTNYNYVCCSQCRCERKNDLFYYCFHCKLCFCEKCQKKHKNTIKNNNIIPIDNLDSDCELHNDKIIGYYEKNHEYKNLCLKCSNMVENKINNINYLILLTDEEEQKINDKFVEEQNIIYTYEKEIKHYEKEIKQLELKIEELKKKKNELQIILEIEKKLYNFCINECNKNKYCYEILKNVRNFLNFKFDKCSQEQKIPPIIGNEIILQENIKNSKLLNKVLCINETCKQILQIEDENYSLITLNMSQPNHHEKKKNNNLFYYIPLYGITPTIQNILSKNICEFEQKEIKELLLKSHNNIQLSSSELFIDKYSGIYFIYPINNSYDTYIRLYIISKKKNSSFPRILLFDKNISFKDFQKQIFFYLRKYLKLPSQNEYEELKRKLNNLDSFYNFFSFVNKEYLKLFEKNDEFNDFKNNLPFRIFIQNQTNKNEKYILWDSNHFGNEELKTNDSIKAIIQKIIEENHFLFVQFNSSNYLNDNEELDKVKINYLENNLIHISLDNNSKDKKIRCPYCNTINEFKFNKKLSNYYIFIFDNKINYQYPLFFKNNQGQYFLYEKDEIKNNFILSQMNNEKLNELINSNKILCFKKIENEKTLLDEIIKDT